MLQIRPVGVHRLPAAVNLGEAADAIAVLELLHLLTPDVPDGDRVVGGFLMAPAQQVLDPNVDETEADGYDGAHPFAESEGQRYNYDCGTNSNCVFFTCQIVRLTLGGGDNLHMYFRVSFNARTPSELNSTTFMPKMEVKNESGNYSSEC